MKIRNLGTNCLLILPPLIALALTGCGTSSPSQPVKPYSPATYDKRSGLGGEIVTDSISRTATVVSVDRVKRLVVLKRADGSEVTYKALPNAFAFDEVKAGDVVKVKVAEELAVYLGRNPVPPGTEADTAKLRVRLPGGAQAVATEVATLTFTAKITALDNWNHAVTLQLPAGQSKTIRVSEYVNLADVSVGDSVSVRATEDAVLELEKP